MFLNILFPLFHFYQMMIIECFCFNWANGALQDDEKHIFGDIACCLLKDYSNIDIWYSYSKNMMIQNSKVFDLVFLAIEVHGLIGPSQKCRKDMIHFYMHRFCFLTRSKTESINVYTNDNIGNIDNSNDSCVFSLINELICMEKVNFNFPDKFIHLSILNNMMFLTCKSLHVCLCGLERMHFILRMLVKSLKLSFSFLFSKNVRFKNVDSLSLNHDIHFLIQTIVEKFDSTFNFQYTINFV